jgi:hypothetical protein
MLGGNISKYEISPEVYYGSARGYELEYTYEISNTIRFLIGCGIEFALTRNVSIEIDGLYFQKGSSIQKLYSPLETPFEIAISDLLLSYNLEGISIPVLLKIKFLSGSSPYILGGGEFSFILSHEYQTIIEGRTVDWTNIKEFTQSFDYGLVLGAGFEVKMETISFFIEGRYYPGLRNIIKGSIDWESAKITSVAIMLGFKI